MIRPHLSDVASRALWLLLAGAAGLVLALLLLMANARPASAEGLDLPNALAPVTQPVTAPIQQVNQTTKPVVAPVVQTAAPMTKPVTATVSQVTKPVTDTVRHVITPVTDTVEQVTTPVTDTLENLPGITLPEIAVPPIQLGPIDTGTVLPPVKVPSIHVGGTEAPPLTIPRGATAGLGGAARTDASVPTVAPFPQMTDPASPAIAPPSLAAFAPDAGSQVASAFASAASPAASGATPARPAPADTPGAPRPAPPVPSPTSGSGDGPNRAPTLLLNFAILCAAIALAHEISRGIGRYVRLPRSQFLTVLIERPG